MPQDGLRRPSHRRDRRQLSRAYRRHHRTQCTVSLPRYRMSHCIERSGLSGPHTLVARVLYTSGHQSGKGPFHRYCNQLRAPDKSRHHMSHRFRYRRRMSSHRILYKPSDRSHTPVPHTFHRCRDVIQRTCLHTLDRSLPSPHSDARHSHHKQQHHRNNVCHHRSCR